MHNCQSIQSWISTKSGFSLDMLEMFFSMWSCPLYIALDVALSKHIGWSVIPFHSLKLTQFLHYAPYNMLMYRRPFSSVLQVDHSLYFFRCCTYRAYWLICSPLYSLKLIQLLHYASYDTLMYKDPFLVVILVVRG